MIGGYARVSTDRQRAHTQVQAVDTRQLFDWTASSAQTDCNQLCRVLAQLAGGDALAATWLDRLARSTPHHSNTVTAILTPHGMKGTARRRNLSKRLQEIIPSYGISPGRVLRLAT